MNVDFNQLFPEICGGIAVAEDAQNLIAAGAEWHTAWLMLVEAAEDGEVEEPADFLPRPSLFRKRQLLPSPVEAGVEFALCVAAEHAKAQLWRPAAQTLHQPKQAIRLLHRLTT